MIRFRTLKEEIDELPPLTEEEKQALDKIDMKKVWAKCQAQLPVSERLTWKVTDAYGNTIKRYKTEEEAVASAIKRNALAEKWGLHMRYRVDHDQGWDE